MQAILTKVLPATNTKPTRIKASCARGSIILGYTGCDEVAHRYVAAQLRLRFIDEDVKQYGSPKETNPWGRPFVTGCLPNGDFAHVFTGGAK